MKHVRVRVLLAGQVGSLRATLSGSAGVEVAAECEDVTALLAAAEARLGEVALVAGDLDGLDRPAVSALHARGIAVVGAVGTGDSTASKQLRRMGVDARIFVDSSPEAVARALTDARGHRRPNPALRSAPRGAGAAGSEQDLSGVIWRQASPTSLPLVYGVARRQVIAVWGPTGAPGRSTIAAGLAGALARRGLETLLIDADTYGGAQASMFCLLDEAPGLVAAIRAADRGQLNVPLLADLSIEVAPRLRVLTGIPAPERWPQIRPPSFENVLGLSRDLARITVVDCGFCLEDDPELSYDTYAPRRNAITLAALGAADDIVVVGRDDVIGLPRLESGLLELAAIGGEAAQVVLNQVVSPPPPEPEEYEEYPGQDYPAADPAAAPAPPSPPPAAGDGTQLAVARRQAAWHRLGGTGRLHQVPRDDAAVEQALLAGLPVSSAAPGTALSLAMDQLARALVPRRGFL